MSDTSQDDLDVYLDEALRDPRFRALYFDGHHRDDIIDRLKARREALGLSVVEVARRMDIAANAVRRIEREGSDPRLSTLQQYARAVDARLLVSIETPD